MNNSHQKDIKWVQQTSQELQQIDLSGLNQELEQERQRLIMYLQRATATMAVEKLFKGLIRQLRKRHASWLAAVQGTVLDMNEPFM